MLRSTSHILSHLVELVPCRQEAQALGVRLDESLKASETSCLDLYSQPQQSPRQLRRSKVIHEKSQDAVKMQDVRTVSQSQGRNDCFRKWNDTWKECRHWRQITVKHYVILCSHISPEMSSA